MSELAQDELRSAKHKTYVAEVSKAIAAAIRDWQSQARFVAIEVHGPIAVSAPGCLQGPPLETAILRRAPRASAWEGKMSAAVAAGLSAAWNNWQRSVFVPRLAWYPRFAAFAGPVAPPTPNVPTPVIALGQNPSAMCVEAIRSGIVGGAAKAAPAAAIADAIATGVSMAFLAWQVSVKVKNVMGQGPVPSYAPPDVPAGPVEMGKASSAPGCFL
jgi:hypothetical protein